MGDFAKKIGLVAGILSIAAAVISLIICIVLKEWVLLIDVVTLFIDGLFWIALVLWIDKCDTRSLNNFTRIQDTKKRLANADGELKQLSKEVKRVSELEAKVKELETKLGELEAKLPPEVNVK